MKWKCTVCGHIHEGDEPPEQCPVCGSPKDVFIQVSDDYVEGSESSIISKDAIEEADVLVVGSGAAGLTAAITARSKGDTVIVLEKAKFVGGTTIRSGGGFWIPNNRFQRAAGIKDSKADALRYIAHYSFPHLYDPESPTLGLPIHDFDLLDAYCDNASEMVEFIEGIGALQTINEINWTGRMQVDYQDHMPENKGIRGRVLYSCNPDGKKSYGFELMRQYQDWCRENDIEILTDHRVIRILVDKDRAVIGLMVKIGNISRTFKARKAVIFCSGGYSHNPDMVLRFQRGPMFGGCAAPTNTGDFITMGTEIGTSIGNMAGAFRAETIFENTISNPDGSNSVFYIPGDSVLEVNKYGHRFVDEKRNYNDRAMTHFVWDPQHAEWMQMLTFMIFDHRTASLWQGFPPYPVQGKGLPPYIITGDTLDLLSSSISEHLDALRHHTGGFSLSSDFSEVLKRTVIRFNDLARKGHDDDFKRGDYLYDREWTTFPPTVPGQDWPPKNSRNPTMYPLSEKGPYYAVILGSGTLDTNGGPIVNSRAQVLNSRGEIIKGLYGAGNCIASPTANAYWGAGSTIGPAMTFGYIAAKNAVMEKYKKK